MTYNVFGGTLNLTQSNPIYDNCRIHKTFTTSLGQLSNSQNIYDKLRTLSYDKS